MTSIFPALPRRRRDAPPGQYGQIAPVPLAPGRRRTRPMLAATTIAGLSAAVLLTGCSVPTLANMSPTLMAHPRVARAEVPAVPAAAVQPARGDLASGSLTRSLDAGALQLVTSYWTSQDPTTWTAGQAVTLRLSAHIEGSDGKHAVKVSRFVATLDDGTTVSGLIDDRGEFVITPPYSYSSALAIRPADHAATAASIAVEFDLLVETSPLSGQFFRQTVLDTVHLTFAKKAAL